MVDLQRYFENIPFHKDIRFSKREFPSLPMCFKPTIWGEPRLGMVGQYRCGLLHAYDFGDYWLIHKDRKNPETHPWEHLVEDAPHLLLAGAAIAGAVIIDSVVTHVLGEDDDY